MADFSWAQFWTTALTTAVSFTAGVRLARYQMDLAKQRTEKQAASALLADLRRLDANLGDSPNAFGSTVYGMTFEAPKIHRWAEPLIVQLATGDPRVVSGYMDLDRELNNFGATVSLLRLAAEKEQEARAIARQLRDAPVDESLSMNELVKRAGEKITAQDRAKEAADPLSNAIRMMRLHHGNAKQIIAVLVRHTSAIARTPDQAFLQLPEEIPRFTD